MFNSRAEYLKIIDEIEKEIRAQIPDIFGISPWFIIRIQLGFIFHLSYAKNQMPKAKHFSNDKIRKISAIILIREISRLVFTSISKYPLQFFPRLQRREIIFVGHTAHNEMLGSNIYNRYIDPLKEKYSAKSSYTLFVNDPDKDSFKSIKFLRDWYSRKFLVLLNLRPKMRVRLLRYGKDINQYLFEKKGFKIENLEFYIAEQILIYKIFEKIFYRVLKRIRPKLIIGYSYYDNKINSLYGAANLLKIDTYEYQHSSISNRHFAYAPWRDIDEISRHLPKKFLVWEETDRELIVNSFHGFSYKPKIEVVGIIGSKYHKSRDRFDTRFNLLICLQGTWIPKWLETYIQYDRKYNWFIRLHPRYPNDSHKLEKLKKTSRAKLRIEEANSLSIDRLISDSTLMLTDFSGSAIEAKKKGKPVCIYGIEGKETYYKEIENKEFFFVESAISLEFVLNAL